MTVVSADLRLFQGVKAKKEKRKLPVSKTPNTLFFSFVSLVSFSFFSFFGFFSFFFFLVFSSLSWLATISSITCKETKSSESRMKTRLIFLVQKEVFAWVSVPSLLGSEPCRPSLLASPLCLLSASGWIHQQRQRCEDIHAQQYHCCGAKQT